MVERVKPSVLKIVTNAGTGSGFIYNVNGQTASVITNRHVVEGATSIEAVYERSTYQAQYVSTDPVRDLAVIEVCCNRSFKPLVISNYSEAKLGTDVYALGYPLGLDTVRVTAGLVSGLDYYSAADEHFIQTDAALNPGNSGGPLVLATGEVVGVNTAVRRFSQSGVPLDGVGWAISVRTVEAALPSLENGLRVVVVPTPTADAGQSNWIDRIDLVHRADGFLEEHLVRDDVRNFSIGAFFEVPHGTAVGGWTAGILFRRSAAAGNWRLYIASNGYWSLTLQRGDGSFEHRNSGDISILSKVGEQNGLFLSTTGDRAEFSVNGQLISNLDLSGGPYSGYLAIAIEFEGDGVLGYTTTVRDIITLVD